MEQKEFVKAISKAISEKKLVLGTETNLKMLSAGKLEIIAYSENTPEAVKKQISEKLGIAKEYPFSGNNIELGELSKRPHRVSVVGIAKDEKKKAK